MKNKLIAVKYETGQVNYSKAQGKVITVKYRA